MMWKNILFTLFLLGNNTPIFGQSTIHGELVVNKHIGTLACSIYGSNGNFSKKLLAKVDSLGKFRFQLPQGVETLVFSGNPEFRIIELPVNNHQASDYYLSLPLIEVDQQTADKPYQQATQKDLLIQSDHSIINKKKIIRYLKIIDVDTSLPIKANVCLFYTKTGLKDCFEIKPQYPAKLTLTEDDIIALEIKSNQYQSYNGNLYINQLNSKNNTYEVGLTKTRSILSIRNSLTEELNIENINDTKPAKIRKIKKDFCSSIQAGQQFHLFNKQLDTIFVTKLGLNLLLIKPKKLTDKTFENIPQKNKYSIQFNQSDFELLNFAKQTLDTIAILMQQNPKIKAQIVGFTDNVGSAEKNQALSEFRAKVSIRYLVLHHIEEDRLSWKGLGGDFPVSQNDTESNKAKNRRVEIILKDNLE